MAGNGLRRRFALGLFAVFGVLGGAYALALPAAEADDDPGPAPSTTTSAPCLPPASFDLFGNCVVHPTMPTSTTTPTTLPPGTPAYVAGDDTDTTTINDAIEIDVIANDVPPAGYSPSTLNVTTEPAHGLATVHDSEFLDYEIIEYAPDFGFEGIDSLEYESCVVKAGAAPLCDRAVVTVTVFGSDMPPTSIVAPTTSSTDSPTTVEVDSGGTVAPTSIGPTLTTVLVIDVAATSTTIDTSADDAAQLPRTGGSATNAWLGFVALAIGGVVALSTRRRHQQS
jgi:LPXTG-motif cell wall-anchored protein